MSHLKFTSKVLFLLLIFINTSFGVSAALRLPFNPILGSDVTINYTKISDNCFTTSGANPTIQSVGLNRALLEDETFLSFDYKSSQNIDFVKISSSRGGDISVQSEALQATSEWSNVKINIAGIRNNNSFGKIGDYITFQFGSSDGIIINVRHIRIVSETDSDLNDSEPTYPEISEILKMGLPILEVETIDGQEPKCDRIDPPEGSWGVGITNAVKVPGSVRRIEKDGTISYDSGEYDDDKQGMTIKVRGNTSALYKRKPFKIKLKTKADLLCIDQKKYADKNWILLNDHDLRHSIGLKINELTRLDWAPRHEYVNLVINGLYRGIYLLCEAIERNTDCRIDTKKTGFITELDPYWWNENGEWLPSVQNPHYNYTFKYPDFADMDDVRKSQISEFLSNYEASHDNGTYDSYVDCESLSRWIMGHDILGTSDFAGANMYMSRYDDNPDTKLRFPLLWDFDTTELTEGDWSASHHMHFDKLFNSENKTLSDTYYNLWNNEGKQICTNAIEFLENLENSEFANAVSASTQASNLIWHAYDADATTYFRRSKQWLQKRLPWIEEHIEEFKPVNADDSGIDSPLNPDSLNGIQINGNIITSIDNRPFKIYNTCGTIVAISNGESISINTPGIYIILHDGVTHKFAVK